MREVEKCGGLRRILRDVSCYENRGRIGERGLKISRVSNKDKSE